MPIKLCSSDDTPSQYPVTIAGVGTYYATKADDGIYMYQLKTAPLDNGTYNVTTTAPGVTTTATFDIARK